MSHSFKGASAMTSTQHYRIESKEPLLGRLLPPAMLRHLYTDRSLAVAVAVKSVEDPTRQRVRVVNVDNGEVVFDTVPGALGS